MLMTNASRKNPLRTDPTRTTMLRRKFVAEMDRRFNRLKTEIVKLIVDEDAFGLKSSVFKGAVLENALTISIERGIVVTDVWLTNERWRPLRRDEQIDAFKQWLNVQINQGILEQVEVNAAKDVWLQQYINEAYAKGSGRSFDDHMRKFSQANQVRAEYYQGTKDQFLRDSFGRPVSMDRVKVLTSRTFSDLKNVTEAMSAQMHRTLVDSFIQGDHPYAMARKLMKNVDGIGKVRARTIARTETIAAHAEGQLDTLKALGVEEVSVMVEWATAGDDRVCDLCADLSGVVLKIDEARMLIPRHPNCRCAWMPANVGEDQSKQKRGKDAQEAISKSIKDEHPKAETLDQAKEKTKWAGGDIKKVGRPLKPIVKADNAATKFYLEGAKNRGVEAKVFHAKVNVKKIHTFNLDDISVNQHQDLNLSHLMGHAPPEVRTLYNEMLRKEAERVGGMLGVTSEKYIEIAQKAFTDNGYEGLVIKQAKFTPAVGGSQVVVFDPANVKLVEPAIPTPTPVAPKPKLKAFKGETAEMRTLREKLESPELNDMVKSYLDEAEAYRQRQIVANDRFYKAKDEMRKLEKEVVDVYDIPKERRTAEQLKRLSEASSDNHPVYKEFVDAKRAVDELADQRRATLDRIFHVDEADRVKITASQSQRSFSRQDYGGKWIQTEVQTAPDPKLEKASDFLSKMVSKKSGSDEVRVNVHYMPEGTRAFHVSGSLSDSGAWMSKSNGWNTYVHELGHRLEDSIKGAKDAANTFREMRIRMSGKPDVKLKDKFPKAGFRPDEVGNPDHFTKAFDPIGAHYIGKRYDSGCTEVISMGLEQMSQSPLSFAMADPQYFKFIVAVLRGML